MHSRLRYSESDILSVTHVLAYNIVRFGSVLHTLLKMKNKWNLKKKKKLKSFKFFLLLKKKNVPKSSTRILSELRWELFRPKHIERNASPYHWHIDSICTADQLYGHAKWGYTSPHPSLPNLEGNGWLMKGLPIKCLVPPAPRAVVELVKCGCKGECKGNCR